LQERSNSHATGWAWRL